MTDTTPPKKFGLTLADLSLAAADRAVLSDFLDSWTEHGRPVLFVGAGMSRHNATRRPGAPTTAEIKDWAGLVQTLSRELAGGDEGVLRTLPTDYLRLAQLHETQFHRVRLLDAVEKALANAHFDPGRAHAMLKRFPWESIITTNYDDLIERAFQRDDSSRPIVKAVWDPDLTRRRPLGALLLVKMHGDIHDRDSVVLTEEDYRCYHQRRPGIALKVKQLLLEHPSLFVGFSLNDPNVGAIDGWIRDTTGQLKLPSIAVVHSEPLVAERDMWGRRGIKLVHLQSGESLLRFFEALQGERESRGKSTPLPRDTKFIREMEQLLERRQEGWETDAAKLLVRLADGTHDAEFASAARFALQGGLRNVPSESVQKVLEAMSAAERRVVLLKAQAQTILKAGGSGVVVLDIEQHLLGDAGISPTDRAGVLLHRAMREKAARKLDDARHSLLEARAIVDDPTLAQRIQKELREVLLRLGDPQAISDELLDAPLPEDSFAYARRGADALLARGRAAARRWYAEALECATNGDEQTAALMGLLACQDPDDWTGGAELDEQRVSILRDERPRAERVYDLQDRAGQQLLNAEKVGPKKQGSELVQAIEKLREALSEADDMGWPRSAGPNLTTVSDGLAYGIVSLLLQAQSSEDLVLALEFAIERGLFGIGRHFDDGVFGRIAAAPLVLEQVRGHLTARPEAEFKARTRALLRSALLPLLTDEQINFHVVSTIDAVEIVEGSFFEKTGTEAHLELLAEHQLVLPREAALHVLRTFAAVLNNETNLSALRGAWLRAPLGEWVKASTLRVDDDIVRELVAVILRVFERGLVVTDFVVRAMALRWVHELVRADLLNEGERSKLIVFLDSELLRTLKLKDQERDRILIPFELARARFRISEWNAPPELLEAFMAGYGRLKNSTAIGTWSGLIRHLAKQVSVEGRLQIARDVQSYVQASLAEQAGSFGPFPQAVASALCASAQSGLVSSDDALSELRRLAKKFPEVWPRVVELPGIDLATAEEEMLASAANQENEYAILMWCQELPVGVGTRHLERIVLGGLNARDGRARQLAYWSAAALAKKDNLSEAGRIALVEAIVTFGASDLDWRARSAAVGCASKLVARIDEVVLDKLAQDASQDDIADTRRAAELLRHAREN